MKNNQVQQPFIAKDGLELYYDVKGKKNTDTYKSTLLDMSGNERHGVLTNFAYEGVSGYTGTPEGGLLLDDVDDKLVRPAISGIEYTSASRNLFNTVQTEWELGTIDNAGVKTPNDTRLRLINLYTIGKNEEYTISVVSGYMVSGRVNDSNLSWAQSHTFSSLDGIVRFVIKKVDETGLTTANITSALIQMEKTSVATAYTPYIPLPIMTYQMNGNVISYEKDGTVKRITKDDNGNEVAVSRKGINLVRNGIMEKTGKLAIGATYLAISYSAILSTTDIIYIRGEMTPHEDGASRTFMQMSDGFGNRAWGSINYPVKNQWYTLEGIITPRAESIFSYINILSIYLLYPNAELGQGKSFSTRNFFAINLTKAYGAGNEPDLAYIQSHPEEFAWTPNPNDLIETVEIKNNLVGDLENLQGNDFEQHEDGVITYTNEAEAGSVVRVDIDGVSDQPLRFRNATGEQVVITEHDQVDADAIKKVEFSGNSVQLADKYREVSGTSVTIDPTLHEKTVADKLVIGGNTTQYTESSNVVTDGLEMWLSGRNFSNSPATTSWKDLTGVNNGTASGFAYTGTSGSDASGGVVFDGVDDRLTVASNQSLNFKNGDFTVDFIMKYTGSLTVDQTLGDIVSKTTLNSNNPGFFIGVTTYGATGSKWGLAFSLTNGAWGTGNVEFKGTVDGFSPNVYYHIHCVRNGLNLYIYRDTVLVATKVLATSYNIDNAELLKIGSGVWGTLRGATIRSLKIYNKALSNEEILQNYNAGVAITVPNIAMPQEVRHVNSGSKVMVRGKNLFNINGQAINRVGHAVSGSISNGRIVYSVVDATDLFLVMCKVLPNTQYTCKIGEHTVPTAQLRVLGYQSIPTDNTIITQTIMSDSSTNAVTFTTGSTVKYVGIGYYQTGMTLGQYMGLIQLEQSATATTYENYATETTIPVTLKSIG